MSNNNFLRIAGIAGILTMVCGMGSIFTENPDVGAPPSLLNQIFSYGASLTWIVLAIGLYLLYRQDAANLSLVAVTVIVLAVLVSDIGTLATDDPTVPIIGEGLFGVGIFLFSWLAYSTGRMPRLLSIVGFIGGLAAVVFVVVVLVTGVATNPFQGVTGVIFLPYLLGLLIWVVWTGIVLVSGKYQPRTA